MEIAIKTAAFFCLLVFFVAMAIVAALKALEMEGERKSNINDQNTDKNMKKKKYITNAFSLQMLTVSHVVIDIDEICEATFRRETADAVSAVGHPDTAAVLRVACNRMNVTLGEGDTLYVAQLVGGRLPEGATTLPKGFTFKYYRVRL